MGLEQTQESKQEDFKAVATELKEGDMNQDSMTNSKNAVVEQESKPGLRGRLKNAWRRINGHGKEGDNPVIETKNEVNKKIPDKNALMFPDKNLSYAEKRLAFTIMADDLIAKINQIPMTQAPVVTVTETTLGKTENGDNQVNIPTFTPEDIYNQVKQFFAGSLENGMGIAFDSDTGKTIMDALRASGVMGNLKRYANKAEGEDLTNFDKFLNKEPGLAIEPVTMVNDGPGNGTATLDGSSNFIGTPVKQVPEPKRKFKQKVGDVASTAWNALRRKNY